MPLHGTQKRRAPEARLYSLAYLCPIQRAYHHMHMCTRRSTNNINCRGVGRIAAGASEFEAQSVSPWADHTLFYLLARPRVLGKNPTTILYAFQGSGCPLEVFRLSVYQAENFVQPIIPSECAVMKLAPKNSLYCSVDFEHRKLCLRACQMEAMHPRLCPGRHPRLCTGTGPLRC